jgi:saccharopine dehydrogenase (NADP+, L-glutamate forming)
VDGTLLSEPATIVGNLLDFLCAQLEKLMSFGPGERDLIMLQHQFFVEWSDGKKVCDYHLRDL